MKRLASTILLSTLVLTACQSQPPTEAMNAGTLMVVAQTFNNNYGKNNDGPVYDRWDKRSQAIISRSDYLHRHTVCPTAPQQTAHVKSAVHVAGNGWLVIYEIDGMQFKDYWYYVQGRWVFDLLQSNPEAVRLYKLSDAAYAAQVGCPNS